LLADGKTVRVRLVSGREIEAQIVAAFAIAALPAADRTRFFAPFTSTAVM
jgi:hypothetical protein